MLQELKLMIDELNKTNSSNDKKGILLQHMGSNEELRNLVSLVYDPNKVFGVTSSNCIKNPSLKNSELSYGRTLIEILEALSERKFTGHEAIELVNGFIESSGEGYRDLIYNCLDKNLKTRTDAKLINKVFPGLVPVFEVALANDYFKVVSKKKEAVNFKKDTWFYSHKLDGLSCLALIDLEGEVTLMSRSGKEFKTLQKVIDSIKAMGLKDCVLDGEICLVDENGNDDFQGIMKQYNRKTIRLNLLNTMCLT